MPRSCGSPRPEARAAHRGTRSGRPWGAGSQLGFDRAGGRCPGDTPCLDAAEAEGPGSHGSFSVRTDGFRCLVVLVSFWNVPRGRDRCPLPPRPPHTLSSAPLTAFAGDRAPRLPAPPRERGRSSRAHVLACGDVAVTVTMTVTPPPRIPGAELNGMAGTDAAEVPPPLPVKGGSADYGSLAEPPDAPPPPHQRVSPAGPASAASPPPPRCRVVSGLPWVSP